MNFVRLVNLLQQVLKIMFVLLLVAGLLLLVAGAEALVRGASRLAAVAGISPLIIGLSVVAFGTSAPELAVSIKAGLSGQAGIAVGNVIGSNIFNILLILGLSAVIAPLTVSQQLIRSDVPVMVAASFAMYALACDARFSRADGLLLVTGLLVYTAVLFRLSRNASETGAEDPPSAPVQSTWRRDLMLVAGGLVLLVIGSNWLVNAAVAIARLMGVSDVIIGLTIVSAGTSLPELVTSVVASFRGERDIAVGNVVGSNLFNILGVLGISSVLAPAGIAVAPGVIGFDLPVMCAVAFACLPIFFTDGMISRWEGSLLVGYYLAYTAFLILAAGPGGGLAPVYGAAMRYFVIPLTLITLLLLAAIAARKHRQR